MMMPYKDPDKQKEYQRKWIQKEERNKPPIGSNRFFSNASSKIKNKAKGLELNFNLDSQYLKGIFPVDGKCPALQITLEKGSNGISKDESPSLDRIDNKLGYIKGNVQWVSRLANQIMTSATPDQVITVGKYFKKITEELKVNHIRDKFSKKDYDKSDSPAKKAMINWLAQRIPDLIIESNENYSFDIRGRMNGHGSWSFYEVEIKYGWTGEWPEHWKELRIPYRKKRLIDMWQNKYKEDLFTFVVFRKDLKKAWHIPADIVMNAEVKEASNKNVKEGEKFFHIPVDIIYQVDMTHDNSSS